VRGVDVLHELLKPSNDALRLRTARVDGFTSTTATVFLAGGTVTAVPYLSTYTPAVGHVVLLLQTTGGLLVIVGRVA
jgi:hypothetical protein